MSRWLYSPSRPPEPDGVTAKVRSAAVGRSERTTDSKMPCRALSSSFGELTVTSCMKVRPAGASIPTVHADTLASPLPQHWCWERMRCPLTVTPLPVTNGRSPRRACRVSANPLTASSSVPLAGLGAVTRISARPGFSPGRPCRTKGRRRTMPSDLSCRSHPPGRSTREPPTFTSGMGCGGCRNSAAQSRIAPGIAACVSGPGLARMWQTAPVPSVATRRWTKPGSRSKRRATWA